MSHRERERDEDVGNIGWKDFVCEIKKKTNEIQVTTMEPQYVTALLWTRLVQLAATNCCLQVLAVLPEDDEFCPLEIAPCITETEAGSHSMTCHVIYILQLHWNGSVLQCNSLSEPAVSDCVHPPTAAPHPLYFSIVKCSLSATSCIQLHGLQSTAHRPCESLSCQCTNEQDLTPLFQMCK